MMTRLARRIHATTSRPDQGGGSWHPAVTPATPLVMPAAAQVTYHPDPAYPWGTVAYRPVHPRYAADGAEIPSTAAGPWGNIHPAGRP